MEFRKIGALSVSTIGLGCNNFGRTLDDRATKDVVFAAIDAGINFFDTADIYGSTLSEQYLGKALGSQRKDVILATKFGKPVDDKKKGARPSYIRQAAEDSLRRLNTDYIDLYQIHEPDPSTPIEETLETLADLVREGKVREIGCSNFSVEQLREAAATHSQAHFRSVQNEYSLLYRQDEEEVLPVCEELGLAYLPYYPLASGLLTGKYRKGREIPPGSRLTSGWHKDRLNETNLNKIEGLTKFAESSGHSLLELAISWLLSHKNVASVIAGATKASQVSANAAAARWQLTSSDLNEIDQLAPLYE